MLRMIDGTDKRALQKSEDTLQKNYAMQLAINHHPLYTRTLFRNVIPLCARERQNQFRYFKYC